MLFSARVHAGGGPENILLVVNANSESSKTIANHYVELRKIPPQNVFYLDWRGPLGITRAKTFRDRILQPSIQFLDSNKLNPQVDYLIYSSDFPTRIEFKDFFPNVKQLPRFDAAGSLTGLTYLAPFTLNASPAVTASNNNWYVPGPRDANLDACKQLVNVSSRPFRAVYMWDEAGNRTNDPQKGQRYLLSTVLGVTNGRGNSVDEILSYLRRAAAADGTRPKGTIYYMTNNDPRSNQRDACFNGMAAEINKLGVRAVVRPGTIPKDAKDVMGLMAGVKLFDWAQSGSVILPGAICEHFTSYGGDMEAKAFQTPLTEFLRYGAAGASGTVREPGAVQSKFPLPSLHLHYVRGCSLAESFYQSVAGPFQLLIVGDPLCQPWAQFPKVSLRGVAPNQAVKGTVTLTPAGSAIGNAAIQTFDIYLDGKLLARMRPQNALNLDTTKLADGHHELRVVGSAGPLETQGRTLVPFTVHNHDAKLELTIAPAAAIDFAASLKVSVSQPGATSIEIRQNSRVLARVDGEEGSATVAAATLGRGPTSLQAFSQGTNSAVSAPVRIVVK